MSVPTLGNDGTLPSTSSNPTWCFSSAFPEANVYEAFDSLFRPTLHLPPEAQLPECQWKAEINPDDDDESFVSNYTSVQFEPVDVLCNLQDLHNVISSATLNGLDLDSRPANRQSDLEMVCFTSYVFNATNPTAYTEIFSV